MQEPWEHRYHSSPLLKYLFVPNVVSREHIQQHKPCLPLILWGRPAEEVSLKLQSAGVKDLLISLS